MANAPVVVGTSVLHAVARREGWTATIEGVAGTFLFLATLVGELSVGVRRARMRRAVAMMTATSVGGVACLHWWDRLRAARRSARVDRTRRRRPADLDAARRSRADLTRVVESVLGGPV